MSEINSQDYEQIRTRIIEFISHELRISPTETIPDFIINKDQYILDSEKIHTILARIADDTGISMIILRNVFPYDRYFITIKTYVSTSFGVFFIIFAFIIFFINKDLSLLLLFFILSFLLFTFSTLKYLDTCFIRKAKPALTIASFIEIMIAIIHEHRDELTFGVSFQERQKWRKKIYEICSRYRSIFWSNNEFLLTLIVPLSDPDEFELPPLVEECAEAMSLSFEMVNSSGIYDKYTDYDDDELLTIVHFADLLIDFWAENRIKTQKSSIPDVP